MIGLVGIDAEGAKEKAFATAAGADEEKAKGFGAIPKSCVVGAAANTAGVVAGANANVGAAAFGGTRKMLEVEGNEGAAGKVETAGVITEAAVVVMLTPGSTGPTTVENRGLLFGPTVEYPVEVEAGENIVADFSGDLAGALLAELL